MSISHYLRRLASASWNLLNLVEAASTISRISRTSVSDPKSSDNWSSWLSWNFIKLLWILSSFSFVSGFGGKLKPKVSTQFYGSKHFWAEGTILNETYHDQKCIKSSRHCIIASSASGDATCCASSLIFFWAFFNSSKISANLCCAELIVWSIWGW